MKFEEKKQKTYYWSNRDDLKKDLEEQGFIITNSVADVLYTDDRVGLWCAVPPTKPYNRGTVYVFSFSGIVSAAIYQNGQPVAESDEIIRKKINIDSLLVRVALKNDRQPVLDIPFIDKRTKSNDRIYLDALANAKKVAEALRDMARRADEAVSASETGSPVSDKPAATLAEVQAAAVALTEACSPSRIAEGRFATLEVAMIGMELSVKFNPDVFAKVLDQIGESPAKELIINVWKTGGQL